MQGFSQVSATFRFVRKIQWDSPNRRSWTLADKQGKCGDDSNAMLAL